MKKSSYLLLGAVLIFTGLCTQIANAYTRPLVTQLVHTAIFLQDRNSIVGFVFNESRQPLADAYVELLSDYNSTLSRTKTNGSGLYTFKGLPAGQYVVKVSHYGGDYEGQTRAVSLVGVSVIPGRGTVNEQVDFYLKPNKNANSGPLAAPGVIFVQEVPNAAKKLYEGGVEDLHNKKNEGFDKLKKALEIFPDYFLALDRLGTEYVVRGYYTPAFVLLTKSVEINPRSFSSSFGLGLALFRLNQIDKAVENLQRATEIYNKSANAYLWLGIALHENKNLTKSEIALTQANKLSKGESADVHWQLARLYKDQKRLSESADELELFLKYKSDVEDVEKIKQMIVTLRKKTADK